MSDVGIWRRKVEPWVRPAFFGWARLTRGATLGVRGVATDADGRVLLLEHSYIPGWHLPGGGVDWGETPDRAVVRELVEEAGVQAEGRPRLLSVHDNKANFPGDYVLLYRIDAWAAVPPHAQGEIIRTGFFPPDAVPEGATPGTRRRLAEVFGGADPDPYW